MEEAVVMKNVCKDFKVLNRHEGLKGSIKDLFSRDYRTVSAVKDVTLTVHRGEIIGYLGPNGAGKSTTIKMMTGVLEPTSGELLVNGKVPYKNRTENCENIGVVFGQRSQLWWSLPLIESFKLLRDLYMVPEKDYEGMLELYRSLVDIEPILHKPVREMSLGQRTLSDILAAFLHNPAIVFLDEPTIGLDVIAKQNIREFIKHMNEKGTTFILTTHDLEDVEQLAKDVIIINKGEKVFDGTIADLRKNLGNKKVVELTLDPYAEKNMCDADLNIVIRGTTVINELSHHKTTLEVDTDLISISEFMNALSSQCAFTDISIKELSMETIITKIYKETGDK